MENIICTPMEPAPQWHIARWFNTAMHLSLESLRGKVIALHAFQMLCPGCVLHGIPQAQRMQETFANTDLVVIGLHTVFEHHEAMQPNALEAFLHEYRVSFPVGVDAHEGGHKQPLTMSAYAMRGTPTLILIDRGGRVRMHVFGRPDDMTVGAQVAGLLVESADGLAATDSLAVDKTDTQNFTTSGCPIRS